MKLKIAALECQADLEHLTKKIFETKEDLGRIFDEVEVARKVYVPEGCLDGGGMYRAWNLIHSNKENLDDSRLLILTDRKLVHTKGKYVGQEVAGMASWTTGSAVARVSDMHMTRITFQKDKPPKSRDTYVSLKGVPKTRYEEKLAYETALVSTHEILHTLDMRHCYQDGCLMRKEKYPTSADLCSYHQKRLDSIAA